MIRSDDTALLTDLFHAAVDAADPMAAMRPHLPDRPPGVWARTQVGMTTWPSAFMTVAL